MKQPIEWNRRRFLQMMGSASLLEAGGLRLSWAGSLGASAREANYFYIGTEHEIHVYSVLGDKRLEKRQTIASSHPAAMTISGGNLYVANGVSQFGSLPCGSVEAYGIEAATGRLELKNRVALSLSAIYPKDLAVSPDGRSLAVAVHGGGAYNILPIQADGRLGKVSGILKELGSGPHASQTAAHPSAVIFDRSGRLLAADQGTDKLSVLSLNEGEIAVADRRGVLAGSGPSSIVLSPNGKRLYVAHALNGTVSSFEYNEQAGRILDRTHTVQTSTAGEVAMLAMHPRGEILYSSHGHGIDVWRIAGDGSLKTVTRVGGFKASRLYVTAEGKSLLALSSDAVLRMKIDSVTYLPSAPIKMATLSSPLSIAIL